MIDYNARMTQGQVAQLEADRAEAWVALRAELATYNFPWRKEPMDTRYTIHQGDVRAVLASLPAESVHTCITSPPYWALRDYGTPGQLGLEATPAEFIANMVSVFREVRRVLRSDGTCWVNIGDSYARDAGTFTTTGKPMLGRRERAGEYPAQRPQPAPGLKPKDLCLIPQRLAIALQDDGWYCRQVITWCKKALMPESVTDRFTSATEVILLLAKSERYYFDQEAVKEPSGGYNGSTFTNGKTAVPHANVGQGERVEAATRNMRNFWVLGPEPFAAAHFATFVTEIPRRAILCSTSERGVCAECGAPWKRVMERGETMWEKRKAGGATMGGHAHDSGGLYQRGVAKGLNGKVHAEWKAEHPDVTKGWQPTCKHTGAPTVPATVLDCFSGAGTTGLVALRLGRHYVGIELNEEYIAMSHRRIAEDAGANQMHMRLEA